MIRPNGLHVRLIRVTRHVHRYGRIVAGMVLNECVVKATQSTVDTRGITGSHLFCRNSRSGPLSL